MGSLGKAIAKNCFLCNFHAMKPGPLFVNKITCEALCTSDLIHNNQIVLLSGNFRSRDAKRVRKQLREGRKPITEAKS